MNSCTGFHSLLDTKMLVHVPCLSRIADATELSSVRYSSPILPRGLSTCQLAGITGHHAACEALLC